MSPTVELRGHQLISLIEKSSPLEWKLRMGLLVLMWYSDIVQSAEQDKKTSPHQGLNFSLYTGPVCGSYVSRYCSLYETEHL
jgi:hypothetical protein